MIAETKPRKTVAAAPPAKILASLFGSARWSGCQSRGFADQTFQRFEALAGKLIVKAIDLLHLGNEGFVSLFRELHLDLKGLVDGPRLRELLDKGLRLFHRLPGIIAISIGDVLKADRYDVRCRDDWDDVGGIRFCGHLLFGLPVILRDTSISLLLIESADRRDRSNAHRERIGGFGRRFHFSFGVFVFMSDRVCPLIRFLPLLCFPAAPVPLAGRLVLVGA